MTAVRTLVIPKGLWHCLFGSTIIHITLFIMVAKMPSTTHGSAQSVEAYIIESSVARLAEPQRPATGRFETRPHKKAAETSQLHQIQPNASPSVPMTNQIAETKASPSIVPTDLKQLQHAPGMASASVTHNTAPGSSLSAHSRENNTGSKPSASTFPNSETGHVMVMGGAGSPRFIHKEAPIYPFVARKLGKEGKVILRVVLNDQGQLQRIDTVEANGFGFAEAATAAIRRSTFAPAVENGRTISSQVLVPIRFVLNEGR